MIFNNNKPVFEQIADYYEKLIIAGAYKYEDCLPSVRDVGMEMLVNPNTVQRAFTKMVEDGYVTNVPKKGFYVIYQKNRTEEKTAELIRQLRTIILSGYTFKDIEQALIVLKEEILA